MRVHTHSTMWESGKDVDWKKCWVAMGLCKRQGMSEHVPRESHMRGILSTFKKDPRKQNKNLVTSVSWKTENCSLNVHGLLATPGIANRSEFTNYSTQLAFVICYVPL